MNTNKTRRNNFLLTILMIGAMVTMLLSSCGSAKSLVDPTPPELENLPDSIINTSFMSLMQFTQLQVYLGNYTSEPLVIRRKVGDTKYIVEGGKFITRDDGMWEEITFNPATMGQVLSFDYTKRQAKVAFEEGNDIKFLVFGLNEHSNFTLYVKHMGEKKSVKWGLYDYEVVSNPGDSELFYDPEKYQSEKEEKYTVGGRSVLSDTKKKKN